MATRSSSFHHSLSRPKFSPIHFRLHRSLLSWPSFRHAWKSSVALSSFSNQSFPRFSDPSSFLLSIWPYFTSPHQIGFYLTPITSSTSLSNDAVKFQVTTPREFFNWFSVFVWGFVTYVECSGEQQLLCCRFDSRFVLAVRDGSYIQFRSSMIACFSSCG